MAKAISNVNKQYQKDTKNIWFPDQVEPDPDDKVVFKEYWKQEKDRCTNGFTLGNGQVYIPGWLYFHTVYWIIEIDKEFVNPVTGKKTSAKTKGTPYLRDSEWIVANDIERAEVEKGCYILAGSRGYGKSFISSSLIGHTYTFISDSECLLTGGNNADINKLGEKVSLGLDSIHPAFQKQRIKKNWKVEVRAGWEDKATGTIKGSNSRILTRNYDDGNNTMATNGTRPLRQIIEESGKIPNLISCVLDSLPSWMNDFGFFSVPILIGTGGDMEQGEDFGKIFNNPGLYYGLEFDDVWEGKGKIGRFIPATLARNEYKEEWTLYRFLTEKYPEQYHNLQTHPDLDRVKILVSDEEKCMREFILPRREKAGKSVSSKELIKEKAYYPIVPSECFLTLEANDFPVEAAQQQKEKIVQGGYKPICVELEESLQGKVIHKFTDKKPVVDFPVTTNSDKTGVIQIVEFPRAGSKWGDYVIGMDPYKVSESDYSDSLGSVYVIKRMTSDMTEPYQHMPVAWYVGRPKNIRDWHERARLLSKYYNAEIMCEANDESFIQYMIGKNEQYFLAKGQSSLREIAPTSKFKGNYGIPANTKTIEFWNNTAVLYTKEHIKKLTSEDGTTETLLGISRILDYMLLEEMCKFNKHSGNYDRIRAFSIGIAYANQLDAMMGKVQVNPIKKEAYKPIKSPFMVNKMGSAANRKLPKSNSPFKMKL